MFMLCSYAIRVDFRIWDADMDAAYERARELLLLAFVRHLEKRSNEWGRVFVRIASAAPKEAIEELASFFGFAALSHWMEERELWASFDHAELASLDGETPTSATFIIRELWDQILKSYADASQDEPRLSRVDCAEIEMWAENMF